MYFMASCSIHAVFFSLVYWPKEDSVTVVGKNSIVSPTVVTVGCDVQVRFGKHICPGKIAAIGKFQILVIVIG